MFQVATVMAKQIESVVSSRLTGEILIIPIKLLELNHINTAACNYCHNQAVWRFSIKIPRGPRHPKLGLKLKINK